MSGSPTTHRLLSASAAEIARAIRNREVSSRGAVDLHIERIERVNPRLNAMVAARFADARAEADRCDAQLARPESGAGNLPPYFGVPCTIKESFALNGMPNSGGLVARRELRCAEDALTVARVRAAGAIPLGVTNVPELCMWMETDSRVYGRTNNPYDHGRIVGGSSGGEGALVGAGATPFGLGSDIGGSIRLPAFFNGVFGHKPTGGLVSSAGQFPASESQATNYLCTGPLCRQAADLMPLVRILAGPEGADGSKGYRLGDDETVEVGKLRIWSVPDNGVNAVSRELRRAQEGCVDALAAQGAMTRTTRIERLEHSRDIWSAMLSASDGPTFGELMGNGRKISLLKETARYLLRRSPHTFPALALAGLERVAHAIPGAVSAAVQEGAELKRELEELLSDDGVMLYPPYTRVAPHHHRPMLTPFDWVYTAIINVMELPSTSVPLGLNREGLPLGVQVVAGRGNDHLCIAVARALETAFGGWVPPWESALGRAD